jgi:hypothetical protein
MNKSHGAHRPPVHQRHFTRRERRIMTHRLKQMLRAGTLVARSCKR